MIASKFTYVVVLYVMKPRLKIFFLRVWLTSIVTISELNEQPSQPNGHSVNGDEDMETGQFEDADSWIQKLK